MKERPILFSAPMVRALLDGSKTQTRRALRIQPLDVLPMEGDKFGREWIALMDREPKPAGTLFRCKFGAPGDRLWVRETFMDLNGTGVEHRNSDGVRQRYAYAAEFPSGSYGDEARKDYKLKWKPSIHMPRVACRILLEVVSVRVERLNDCSEADARAEGATHYEPANDLSYGGWSHDGHYVHKTVAESYKKLWECINGADSWGTNPWVWVIEFKRITPARATSPMNRSAGMRCPACCAKAGEPHQPSCPEYEHTKENH